MIIIIKNIICSKKNNIWDAKKEDILSDSSKILYDNFIENDNFLKENVELFLKNFYLIEDMKYKKNINNKWVCEIIDIEKEFTDFIKLKNDFNKINGFYFINFNKLHFIRRQNINSQSNKIEKNFLKIEKEIDIEVIDNIYKDLINLL